jgi:nucleoside-diphosphate-sugar epimerase
VIDSSLARQELGWAPRVGIDEGLSEVVDWVDRYWDEISRSSLTYQHAA